MGCPNFFKYHPEALANPEEGLRLYARKFGHDVETLVQAVEKTEQYQKTKEQGKKQSPDFSTYYFVMHALHQMDKQDRNLVNEVYRNFIKNNTEQNPGKPQETKTYKKKKQSGEQKVARDETVQIKKTYSEKKSEEQRNEQGYQTAEVSDKFKRDDFSKTIHLERNSQGTAFTETENSQVAYVASETKSEYTQSDMHIDVAAGNSAEVLLSDIYETITSSGSSQTINLTVNIENQRGIVNPMPAIDIGDISFEPREINADSYQTLDMFLTANKSKVLEYKIDAGDVGLSFIKNVWTIQDKGPEQAKSASISIDLKVKDYAQLIPEEITVAQNPPEQTNNISSDTSTEIKNYSQLTLEKVVSSGRINQGNQIINIDEDNYTETGNTAKMFEIYIMIDTGSNEIDKTEEAGKTRKMPETKETVSDSEPVKANEQKAKEENIESVVERYSLTYSKRKAKENQYSEAEHNEKYLERKQSYSDESRATKRSVEINSTSDLEVVASESNEKRLQLNHLVEPYLDMVHSYIGISPGIKTALDTIEEIESYDKKYGVYLRKEFFDKLYSLIEEIEKENKHPKKTKKKKSKELAKKLDELIMKILKAKRELISRKKSTKGKRWKKSRKKRVLKKSSKPKKQSKLKKTGKK